jgi:hypothetical protein
MLNEIYHERDSNQFYKFHFNSLGAERLLQNTYFGLILFIILHIQHESAKTGQSYKTETKE